jgi:hypothetical protein
MAADCAVWPSVRFKTWFDRKQQSRSRQRQKKDRYVPLSEHLIRGLKKYETEKLKIIF